MAIFISIRRILGPAIRTNLTKISDTAYHHYISRNEELVCHQRKLNAKDVQMLSQPNPVETHYIPIRFFNGPLPPHQYGQAIYDSFKKSGTMAKYPGFPGTISSPVPIANELWFAKTVDHDKKKGAIVRESGGGVGRLDAANEAGFFHRTNKSRLEELKRKIKKKPDVESKDPSSPQKKGGH